MKKPDRFERMAENAADFMMTKPGRDEFVSHVANLLRKEHRAAVKMVRNRKQAWEQPLKWVLRDETNELRKARANECQDILAKLTERGK